MCPLDYYGAGRTAYRDRFGELLDRAIVVYWTGCEIVSPITSRADAEEARAAFGHELLLRDNYPVNDFALSGLFLGHSSVATHALPVTGLIANGTSQAGPSKLGFATAADHGWNPTAYDPERSFASALREVGPHARMRGNARCSSCSQASVSRTSSQRGRSALCRVGNCSVWRWRALAVEPRAIVADEPTSALDVSVQAQILNLLQEIRRRRHLALLVVFHDMRVIRFLADRTAVMYRGEIVEVGPTERVYDDPQHPYTKTLIAAAPRLNRAMGRSS